MTTSKRTSRYFRFRMLLGRAFHDNAKPRMRGRPGMQEIHTPGFRSPLALNGALHLQCTPGQFRHCLSTVCSCPRNLALTDKSCLRTFTTENATSCKNSTWSFTHEKVPLLCDRRSSASRFHLCTKRVRPVRKQPPPTIRQWAVAFDHCCPQPAPTFSAVLPSSSPPIIRLK